MDQVTTENGCLHIIPKSHIEYGQIQVEMSVEDRSAQEAIVLHPDDSNKAIAVTMKAGDALLIHAHTLHRSMGNVTQQPRRILFCRYSDADSVEVCNENRPRLGKVVAGGSRFEEVNEFEKELDEKLSNGLIRLK
jgi:ectoine hydroxylase-related dioxygenase (phytanoyl-CoA dioxygenase family)